LKAWGYNTVFQTPLGWDVKILETNGRGWEVFGVSKEDAEKEIVIALTGSTVMVDGGTGFANAGIHQQVKADLIEKNGKLLSEVVTTQILAPWTVENYGIDALSECARVEWDTRPPGIRKEEGESLSAFGAGISAANQALAPYGKSIDMQRLSVALNVPLQDGAMKAPESEPKSPPKAEEPTLIA
jgi:phage gp29-like protein